MREDVKRLALEAKGFLLQQEGLRLYALALESSPRAPCLEVGSYCGKSTLFLAEGCRVARGHPLFAVDHHRGSEEQQPGQPYFDEQLVDPADRSVDTLGVFMRNIRQAGLSDWVIPLVGESRRLSRYWSAGDLGLVFIDGGHSEEDAFGDFHAWAGRVIAGGYLCIHDVFTNPADGGQAPRQVMEYALSTGVWEFVDQVASLGVLRRRSSERATYILATGDPLQERAEPRVARTRYLGGAPATGGPGWTIIGQDGGQSIPLGDRTLFVFSDTLFAVPRKPHLLDEASSKIQAALDQRGIILANTAAISQATTLERALADLSFFVDDAGYPREILVPTPAERERGLRFWPQHGVLLDGVVYLYYLGIETLDPRSAWGFRNVGVGLARLDPRSGDCERVRSAAGDWVLWETDTEDLHLGVRVLREGDDVYVFASRRHGLTVQAEIARVRAGRLHDPNAYEFRPQLGPCSPEYSVSYNAHLGRYLMLYVDGYEKSLMLRTAEAIDGPYSMPRNIGQVPHEAASELVYLGCEHPEFSERNGQTVYVTYSQPRFTPISLIKVDFA